MSSSIIPPRLIKRLEIGTITNEDLYEIYKHISCERKIYIETHNSDLAPLLLHLSKLIKDLKYINKWRKRLRLIKRIFKYFHINDCETFPFPPCNDEDFCISIPFKFGQSERAKEEFFKVFDNKNLVYFLE